MIIKKIRIENFKGIQNLEINLDPGQNHIRGKNGSGKTRIRDAFTWLFFDKDSAGQTKFDILPMPGSIMDFGDQKYWDGDGERPVAKVQVEIEGLGTETTLEKSYQEKEDKFGKVKTTIVYKIDGVKTSATDFKNFCNTATAGESYPLLTDPLHFGEMHWKERRTIVFYLAGEVDDAAAYKNSEWLKGKNPEDEKSKANEALKDLKKQIAGIPTAITALKMEAPKRTTQEIDDEIESLQASLNETPDAKSQNIKDGIAALEREKRNKIASLEDEAQAKTRLREKKIHEAESENTKLESELAAVIKRIWELEKQKEDNEAAIKKLRTDWTHLDAQNYEASETCPICERPMPGGMIGEARASWNRHKAEQLGAINESGKKRKAEIEEIEKEIEHLQTGRDGIEKSLSKSKEECENRIKFNAERQEEEKKEIENKKNEYETKIESMKASLSEEPAETKTDEIKASINALIQEKAYAIQCASSLTKIESLKKDQTEISGKIDEAEKALNDIKEYEHARAEIFQEAANKIFSFQFRMFEKVKGTGDLVECCEIENNRVAWKNLNPGQKVNIGIEAIGELQIRKGVNLPVWIDNRESVIHIPEFEGQIINLSAVDTDLTINGGGTHNGA